MSLESIKKVIIHDLIRSKPSHPQARHTMFINQTLGLSKRLIYWRVWSVWDAAPLERQRRIGQSAPHIHGAYIKLSIISHTICKLQINFLKSGRPAESYCLVRGQISILWTAGTEPPKDQWPRHARVHDSPLLIGSHAHIQSNNCDTINCAWFVCLHLRREWSKNSRLTSMMLCYKFIQIK